MDNGATNKNQFMIQYAKELVQHSYLDSINFCFLVAGHAKFDPDRLFSNFVGAKTPENNIYSVTFEFNRIHHTQRFGFGINDFMFNTYSPPQSLYTQEEVDLIINKMLEWDTNNDGKIGLIEAIRSLQISTGVPNSQALTIFTK